MIADQRNELSYLLVSSSSKALMVTADVEAFQTHLFSPPSSKLAQHGGLENNVARIRAECTGHKKGWPQACYRATHQPAPASLLGTELMCMAAH